jgi:hypothetical protein
VDSRARSHILRAARRLRNLWPHGNGKLADDFARGPLGGRPDRPLLAALGPIVDGPNPTQTSRLIFLKAAIMLM